MKLRIIPQILIILGITFVLSTGTAFAISQLTDEATQARTYNGFVQTLGTGLSTGVDTFTWRMTGANGIYVNGSNFLLIQYDSGTYTYDYATRFTHWYGCGASCISGISATPTCQKVSDGSNALNGSNQLTTADEVQCTLTYSSTISLNPAKYYAFGSSAKSARGSSSSVYTDGVLKSLVSNTYATRYDIMNQTYAWDTDANVADLYFTINGDTGLPVITTDTTETATDYLDQQYTISGSGDFDVTGDHYHAQMQYIRGCSDGESLTLDSETVYIDWFTDDVQDKTVVLDDYHYLGEGYTPTDSTYSFAGVKLPFIAGKNCTYFPTLKIWDETDPYNPIPIIISDENDGTVLVLPEYTPDTSVPNEPFLDGEPNTLYCSTFDLSCYYAKFWSSLKNFFTQTFGFSAVTPNFKRNLGEIRALFATKAPFGYFDTAFAIDVTAPTVTDNVPDFVYPLSASAYGGMSDITVNFPTGIDTITNSIRTVLTVALWLLFFAYIIFTARRIKS